MLGATADVNGRVTLTFTLAPAGTYEFVVKVANAAVVSTQTVKVLGVVAGAAPIKVGQLSRRGFDAIPLTVDGGLLVFRGRRRRSRRQASQVGSGFFLI